MGFVGELMGSVGELMGSVGLTSHPDRCRDIDNFRQKEIKESELRNCRYLTRDDSRIAVGAAGDVPTRFVYDRPSEQEPREVSDHSGSDGDFVSRKFSRKRDFGVLDDGNKRFMVDNEKKKFSSFAGNRDRGKADRHVSGKKSQTSHAIAPTTVHLPEKNDIAAVVFSHVSIASESARSVSPLSTVEDESDYVGLGDNLGAAVLDEYASLPSISACRWANDAESPADLGERFSDVMPKVERKMPDISEDKDLQKLKRKRSVLGYSESTGQRKPVTDDFVEFSKGGSEGNDMVRSSDERTWPSSCCTYQDEDEMDISLGHHQIGPISSDLETDLDDNCSPYDSPPGTVNMLQGCRSVDEFEKLGKINEGTYGVVYKARDTKTGDIVALKKVKMEKEEGFPLTALREINILVAFHHPSVVGVKEVVVGSGLNNIFMSMEYMDHELRELMESMKQPFSQSEVKCLMLQLLEGVKYLHDNWVLHRDLKTSNLLLNNNGELKICDFGLARQYGSPLKPYTALVVTLWYRAPELLLGADKYSTAIDMWSVGCIMAELLSKKPLFDGKKEVNQLEKIFKLLGTPNEKIWPGFSKLPGAKANFVNHRYNCLRKKFPATSFTGSPVLSEAGFCLLNSLLTYDPKQRITADDALKHEWFQEAPLPREKECMPTYPSQHAWQRVE